MSAPSNPNPTDKSTELSNSRDNVSYSNCPRFVDNNNTDRKGKMEMKRKVPLPIPQHKSSSTFLAGNPRVNLTLEKAIEYELKYGRKLDPNMDNKKIRRTISNRLSAQRSRMKRAQYINEMEQMVDDLEELISVLNPQIQILKEKQNVLALQNDSLQKLIEIRSNETKLSETELEHNRLEIYRLKKLEKFVNKSTSHDALRHLCKFDFGFGKSAIEIKVPVEVLKIEKDHEELAETDQYLNLEVLNVNSTTRT